MATTTTNYGFDIPQSTDLVKDGATAIATLGQDIDTAMNTALGTKKAGMVLLSSVAFSAVASQSVNDVFSATYDTYKIYVSISAGTNTANLGLRMRVSGTDNSSSNYENGLYYIGGYDSQVAGSVNSNTNTFFGGITDVSSTAGASFEVSLYNPFGTAYTKANWQGIGFNAISGGGVMTVNTSYTGFTVYVSTGNITGSVSVFGVNK
jgi:hypothetical protein